MPRPPCPSASTCLPVPTVLSGTAGSILTTLCTHCTDTSTQHRVTLLLLPGTLMANSCASSLAGSLRYHHWISKEYEVDPLARKAQGISISSPSLTVTSLGTSVKVPGRGRQRDKGWLTGGSKPTPDFFGEWELRSPGAERFRAARAPCTVTSRCRGSSGQERFDGGLNSLPTPSPPRSSGEAPGRRHCCPPPPPPSRPGSPPVPAPGAPHSPVTPKSRGALTIR